MQDSSSKSQASSSHVIELNCTVDGKQLLETLLPDTTTFVQRSNVDGGAAIWIAVLTVSLQTLQNVIKAIIEAKEKQRVTRIKVGDIEIENPSEDDLKCLRERILNDRGADES